MSGTSWAHFKHSLFTRRVLYEHWGWNSSKNKNNLRTNWGWDYAKYDLFFRISTVTKNFNDQMFLKSKGLPEFQSYKYSVFLYWLQNMFACKL